jgi:phage shock protein A
VLPVPPDSPSQQSASFSYIQGLRHLYHESLGIAQIEPLVSAAQQLQQQGTKLEDQARQALAQNREDLAREALARRAAIASQLADLKAQHDHLDAEEAKLVDASHRLESKVEAFRTRKETIKACRGRKLLIRDMSCGEVASRSAPRGHLLHASPPPSPNT